MSLQAKIEAVIYASEEPVTLQQLVVLLQEDALAELDRMAAEQGILPLNTPQTDDADDREAQDSTEADPNHEALVVETEPATEAPADAEEQASEQADDAGITEAATSADPAIAGETQPDRRQVRERERAVRNHIRDAVDGLVREYATGDRGIEIREVASGYRMATKAEYHDAVRGFVKSLKPALKLTLPALETLAVVAYKQPVTAAELSEIRGVDSSGVLGGLLSRKLIATAGRKQVIGRPMLYKTTRDFLLRFGLKDVNELPSMDEFERIAGELVEQDDGPTDGSAAHAEQAAHLIEQANVRGDAEHIRAVTGRGSAGTGPLADAGESDDRDESDDALEVEAAALASDTTTTDDATAETAAGGNDDRHSSAAAAPLHTAETRDAATEHSPEQAGDPASGQAPVGAEKGERGSEA